ncbi:hypothetical protein [Campylobacter jejuni]|nr:hypothetical protein [Campylobacter jejuni]MCW1474983.1 hypothetical protein [Campylobacter jejuni]
MIHYAPYKYIGVVVYDSICRKVELMLQDEALEYIQEQYEG